MEDESSCRILSSGRKVGGISSSVHRVLKSGRCLTDNQPQQKKQRTLYSQIGTILHENDANHHHQDLSSQIHVSERKPRENEPSKKLLLQAVSDANKSVTMKLKKTNGIVQVMKPDGTTECLTTKNLAKRLKAKEPTWIDPSSLTEKGEPILSKMKIRIRNEYCSNTDDDVEDTHQEDQSNEQNLPSMEFEDDDEDEFIVVVNNNDDDINNIWMLNDYPYDDNDDENRGNNSMKRKLSDERLSDEIDEREYSPLANQQTLAGKKSKRCRFWPDCHNGEQCEFVHPTQRCTHFPNCVYGVECLYIHPPCRFGSACTRSDCLYTHSSATPASSPNDNAATGRAPATRPESSTLCKFGVQCMRPNCMYSHPRMPFPSGRNYKWVNSKWRASDDTPLLPPTPKDTVYENPFVAKPSNSNGDSIEK